MTLAPGILRIVVDGLGIAAVVIVAAGIALGKPGRSRDEDGSRGGS